MKQKLQEIKKQGTPMHPLKIYKMQEKNERIDVPYHWQETAEIIWIQKGELSLMVRQESYTGTCGDIFYINPCDLHSMQSLTQDCTYLAFIFPILWLQFDQADEAGEKYLKPLAEQTISIAAHLPQQTTESAAPVLKEIYTLYENNDNGAWLGIKANLLRFYYYIYRDGMITHYKKASKQMDLLLKISQYIQEHCSETLSLQILGEQFHMSPKYFSVYFQKHFSRNFADYLTAIRLERAKKLLLETDIGMELLAQQTGFSSSSYFVRVFHQSSGITPGQYRKEFRQNYFI